MKTTEEIDKITKQAAALKDLANSKNENFQIYKDAWKLYDEAYTYCKESTLVVQPQKDFLTTIYLYESFDCQISFSIKKDEFEKCSLLCSMQEDAIDELFSKYQKNQITEPEVLDWYRTLQNHKISTKYKIFFAIGKSLFKQKKYKEALHNFRRTEEIIRTIDTASLNEDFFATFQLNVLILKFNISQCQIGIFPTMTLNRDFLERQIIKELLDSFKYATDVANCSDDPHYQMGKQQILGLLDQILSESLNDWQVLLDYTRSTILWDRMINLDSVRVEQLKHFDLLQKGPKVDYLLFYTHGFNTRGEWKNDFTEIISSVERTSNIHFILLPWDYGTFKFGRFLRKKSRQRIVKEFIQRYREIMDTYGECKQRCIVAHSFGTYVTGSAFQDDPTLKCDKLILAGNILNRDFNWDRLKGRNQINQVLIEQSVNDLAVLAAKIYKILFFRKWIGDAGRTGFNKEYPFMRILKTRNGHSGMLNKKNMADNWCDFLINIK